ncbi:hypothetical protein G3A39_42465 [Paraburkholderia aspalathi]|nr:hypothetical protein [Paraburkholderia aspalathi]
MAKVTLNDIYNHIAEALSERMPLTGEAEVGMDHTKLFLRMGGQVFSIQVEEKKQFAATENPTETAMMFMTTLPYPFKNGD